MTSPTELQHRLFTETREGEFLNRAISHGREYLAETFDRHVAPDDTALGAMPGFDVPLPEHPASSPLEIIDQLHKLGSPATMAQTGGRFFGLVNGATLPASLGARILADCWDQNAVLQAVSPVNAKIEEVCERWLAELLGLPANTAAGYVSGTSAALLCGIAAARFRLLERLGWNINKQGLNGAPVLRIVTGEHTHSTVVKAVALLGFGTNCIEYVQVDGNGKLLETALPTLDDHCIVILQAGNVNSGAFDPVRSICNKAHAAGAWVHVDGAFGLWASACSSLAHLTDGLELAHSWSVDCHKTLNAPYDCGVVLCADREALIMALQNSAAYIMYSGQRDGMLYTPEMSRRARAIDIWAALSYLGKSGVDSLVAEFHARARQFAQELEEEGFEILNDVVFNQVITALNSDEETKAAISHIQQSGEAWVGGSNWFGRDVIRISVCSWATTAADVSRAVRAFVDARASINKR